MKKHDSARAICNWIFYWLYIKIAKVRLSNRHDIFAHIPGEQIKIRRSFYIEMGYFYVDLKYVIMMIQFLLSILWLATGDFVSFAACDGVVGASLISISFKRYSFSFVNFSFFIHNS